MKVCGLNLLLAVLVFIQALPVPTCLVDDVILGTLPEAPTAHPAVTHCDTTLTVEALAADMQLSTNPGAISSLPEDTPEDWIKPAIPVAGPVHLTLPVDFSTIVEQVTVPSFVIPADMQTIPAYEVSRQQFPPLLI